LSQNLHGQIFEDDSGFIQQDVQIGLVT
jgi:hypothetical protein